MGNWRPIRSHLLDRGMVIPDDAEKFLKSKAHGFVAMVNKEQYDPIVSNTLAVRNSVTAEYTLAKLKIERLIMELFQYHGKDEEKVIFSTCTIDENNMFKFDSDTFFIPIVYYASPLTI